MSGRGRNDAQERITQLHDVAVELQAAGETDTVYDAIIDAAVDILGFDWCSIAVPVGDHFVLRRVSEAAPLEAGKRTFRVDEGIAGRTYKEQMTIILDHHDQSDEAKPIRDSFTSGLSVPLGEWGIFQGVAEEANAFDEHDREAAELLATHATAALNRIEHEQALKEKNEQLEKFASVVSHDLRNPLNVAELRLDLVRNECQSDHLDDIEQALDRMEQLISDLLLLARSGDEIQDVEPVDLHSLAQICWDTLDSNEASLDVETDLTLVANASRLRQVLENLMKNAVEHGSTNNQSSADNAGSDVTVRVGSLEDGFYVEDDGPGIPRDERDDVFKSGYSTTEDSTGFGLSIVADVVEAHGWEVDLTESDEGGARFEITGVTTET